jgi:hypothetical protein
MASFAGDIVAVAVTATTVSYPVALGLTLGLVLEFVA